MNDIYQYLIAAKTLVDGISNNKVANFAYTQTAYTEDTVDGVAEYSYGNDQNIPLGSHTDLEQNVRDKGIRSQAASLPRNAINHFFGRVSYNLNKITDTLNSFIAQITRAFTQNGSFYSALAEYKQYDTCTILVTEDGGNLLKTFLRTSSVPEVIQGVIPIYGGVVNTEHWKLMYSTDTVTQVTTDSSTKIASTELVDNKIAAYNSLVNAALATKANLESPAFTGSPTVNGETILHSGSDIDADTVDGIDSSRIIFGSDSSGSTTITNPDSITKTGFYTLDESIGSQMPEEGVTYLIIHLAYGIRNYAVQFTSRVGARKSYYRIKNKGTWTPWVPLWQGANDGSGSGLDADTVDGIDFVNGAAGIQGYFTVSRGSTLVIPKGLYMMAGEPATHLQVNYSGSWFGSAPSGGLVLSDGVNYRLKNVNTTYNTRVDYRKLA